MYPYVNIYMCALNKTGVATLINLLITLLETPTIQPEMQKDGNICTYVYIFVNVCRCILNETGVAALNTALVTLVETPANERKLEREREQERCIHM